MESRDHSVGKLVIDSDGSDSVAANFGMMASTPPGAFHQVVMMIASRPRRTGISVHKAWPIGFDVRQTTGSAP